MMKPNRIRWADHVARMRKKTAYGVFLGKPEEKRLLGRPRRGLEHNIKVTNDKLRPAFVVKLQCCHYYTFCGVKW
jgi:hypothetical protein